MINDPSDKKEHWENIYGTKKKDEVSWYEPSPRISMEFIHKFNVPKNAKIIDVGGGNSAFVDHLLEEGYENITVLDISSTALAQARIRLGKKANIVTWIVSDITEFKPGEQYDFWHDRAVFHFLTDEKEIQKYIDIAGNSISKEGILVLGTFSENGPLKCSGIEIKQYSSSSLAQRFQANFATTDCFTDDHITPSEKVQNFVFCSFRKK